MALTIDDAGIHVTITRETRSPSQKGFGSLLFLLPDAAVTPGTRVKSYTTLAGVLADETSASQAYKAAREYYGQIPNPIDFLIGRFDPGEAIVDEIALMVAANPEFYALCPDVSLRDSANITAIAAWVRGNDRYLFHTSNDPLVKDNTDTTNIMYLLQQNGEDKTTGMFSSVPDQYPCAAAFAKFATISYRGTDTMITLKFKDLLGITSESLSSAELAAIKGFYCSVLYTAASIRMVDDGRTAGGSWTDEVIATDALSEEIRVRVFGLMSRTSTKIAYTEKGMALIKAQVEGALLQYVRNGFLAERVDENGDILPAYTVSSGKVIDASLVDKSARIAPNVDFEGRLASAIHDILIDGNLVLD